MLESLWTSGPANGYPTYVLDAPPLESILYSRRTLRIARWRLRPKSFLTYIVQYGHHIVMQTSSWYVCSYRPQIALPQQERGVQQHRHARRRIFLKQIFCAVWANKLCKDYREHTWLQGISPLPTHSRNLMPTLLHQFAWAHQGCQLALEIMGWHLFLTQ